MGTDKKKEKKGSWTERLVEEAMKKRKIGQTTDTILGIKRKAPTGKTTPSTGKKLTVKRPVKLKKIDTSINMSGVNKGAKVVEGNIAREKAKQAKMKTDRANIKKKKASRAEEAEKKYQKWKKTNPFGTRKNYKG